MPEQDATAMRPQVRTAHATDGRTDGLTENRTTAVDQLTAVDVRARIDRMATVGEVLEVGIFRTPERHPVIRSGERDEIPPHVRSAVWYRDRGKCELCPSDIRPKLWHLDHITPWSAGGSDRTDNLRVLCEPHNMQRGNHVDPTERPRMSATWWCVQCFDYSERLSWSDDVLPACPIHRGLTFCRVVGGYMRWFKLHGEFPTWHQRDPIRDDAALTLAYCAHCDAPGLTDQPL